MNPYIILVQSPSGVVQATAPQGPAGAGGVYYTENVASVDLAMIAQNQYLVNKGSSLLSLSLPTSCPINSRILVNGNQFSSGGWKITQNAGQTIWQAGGEQTTTGTAGYLQSSTSPALPNSTVELRCIRANTDFLVTASTGLLSSN